MGRLCLFCESSSRVPGSRHRGHRFATAGSGRVCRSRSRRGTRAMKGVALSQLPEAPFPTDPGRTPEPIGAGTSATWPIPAGAPTSRLCRCPGGPAGWVLGSGARSGGAGPLRALRRALAGCSRLADADVPASLERQAHRDRRRGGHRLGFGRSGRGSGGYSERHRRPDRHVRPRRSGRFRSGRSTRRGGPTPWGAGPRRAARPANARPAGPAEPTERAQRHTGPVVRRDDLDVLVVHSLRVPPRQPTTRWNSMLRASTR